MNNFGLFILLAVVTLFYGINKSNCDEVVEEAPPFVNPTDPICNASHVKCKDMPTVGNCVGKDPTNNPLAAKAGKHKMCCPIWECTHANGSISEHWGMTGGKNKSSKTETKTETRTETKTESQSESNSNSSSSSSGSTEKVAAGRNLQAIQATKVVGVILITNITAINTTGTVVNTNTTDTTIFNANKTQDVKTFGLKEESSNTKIETTMTSETITVSTTTIAAETATTTVAPDTTTSMPSKSKNSKYRPSTSTAPQCKDAQCFPPPTGQVCTAGNVTDCSVLVVLGPLAGCCSAYSCLNSTTNIIDTHFGLTDGVSETVLNYGQTPEESKKPPKCEASQALENSGSTENPSEDSSKSKMSEKVQPRIMYIESCSSVTCIPPPNVNLTNCEKYDDWLTGKLVSLGVTKTCCPVWFCTQSDATVINQFAIDAASVNSAEGIAVPLQLNQTANPDDENIPKQVLQKEKSYSKCPKVKCTPPIVKGMCTASKSSSSVKSGPLRKSKQCCPMWECNLDNGGYLNVYGRTTTDEADLVFGEQKQAESIFQQLQANNGEEEVSETDFDDGHGMRGHTKTFKKKWSATAQTGLSNKLNSNTVMSQSSKKADEMGYGQFFIPPKGWNQFSNAPQQANPQQTNPQQSMNPSESKTKQTIQEPNQIPATFSEEGNTTAGGSRSLNNPEPMPPAVRNPPGTVYQSPTGGYPAQGGGSPGQQGGFPAQGGGFPAQGGGFPGQGGGFPGQGGGFPGQGFPGQGGGFPGQGGGFPGQGGGFPGQEGGVPGGPPKEGPPGQLGMPWVMQQQPKSLAIPPLPQIPQMPQMPEMPQMPQMPLFG